MDRIAVLRGAGLTIFVGGFCALLVVVGNVHPLPAKFTRTISLDPGKVNPRGDHEFSCETDYCNPTDRYIGVRDGAPTYLYEGLENVVRGKTVGRVVAVEARSITVKGEDPCSLRPGAKDTLYNTAQR